MVPENEGKPAANMTGRTGEDSFEGMAMEVRNALVKMQAALAQMEEMCSSDLMSSVSVEGDSKSDSQDPGSTQLKSRPETIRVLATNVSNVKMDCEVALMKIGKMIPRPKGSDEDMSSNPNLQKRSRPLHDVPRVLGISGSLDSKLGILPLPMTDGSGGDSHGINGSPFDSASPAAGEMPLLKMIRTGENTKAPAAAAYQKPPSNTIFAPTAKLGVPMLDVPNVPASGEAAAAGIISKPLSSPGKKRPSRSRRDRNRARNKVVVLPEPVMQKLKPGDTNKIPDDGYLWRKYGNKPIKTASYKRGYYKCRHFKEVRCNATKIVQQTNNDPSTFSVSYKGEHTCKQQGLGARGSCRPQLGGQSDSAGATLADQVNSTGDPKTPGEAEKADHFDEMEWPRRDPEDSCDSGSEDLLTPSDGGEDAVDSVRMHLETPSCTLLDFPMPANEIAVETPSPWEPLRSAGGDIEQVFSKVKYQPIDTSPPEGQDLDHSGGLMSGLDDSGNDQLLKIISGGWPEHCPSDINFWYSQDLEPYSQVTDLF